MKYIITAFILAIIFSPSFAEAHEKTSYMRINGNLYQCARLQREFDATFPLGYKTSCFTGKLSSTGKSTLYTKRGYGTPVESPSFPDITGRIALENDSISVLGQPELKVLFVNHPIIGYGWYLVSLDGTINYPFTNTYAIALLSKGTIR